MTIYNLFKIGVVVTVATFTFITSSYAANYVSVTKDDVNVREGPSTSEDIYMELFKDFPLKVLEKKGDWLKVSDFEGDQGWIYTPLTKKGNTVIVNAKKSVNMRAKASTSSDIIANVERGVVLTVLESKSTWTKVKHSGGTIGWIYNKLLWP